MSLEETPVALVTGSRTGLGRYLSQKLVAAGYCVAGCSRKAVDWTLDGYHHFCVDVSSESEVSGLLTEVRRRFGRLDVLVNNAGVASMNHCLLTPASTVERIMATNVQGTFLASRESAKVMKKHNFGRIVNLTTVAVPLNLQGESVYVASKSAIEALTKVMSRELAEFGITVNAVGPGPIETDLIRNVPERTIQALVQRLSLGRMCQPDEVFHVLQFLIDPRSACITGQIVYLGGP